MSNWRISRYEQLRKLSILTMKRNKFENYPCGGLFAHWFDVEEGCCLSQSLQWNKGSDQGSAEPEFTVGGRIDGEENI